KMKKIVCLTLFTVFTLSVFSQKVDKKLFGIDYIKEISKRATDWQLQHPKHNPRDWTNGAFYAGVYAAWQTTGSYEIYNALLGMGYSQSWKPYGRWYHADDIAINQVY